MDERMDERTPSILVVEDELLIAVDMKNTLESMGYSVPGTAESGEKALSILKEKKPDLVLMDIQLPGKLDGIETAQIVHEQFRIPVIYVSAFSDQNTIRRAKISQPFGYITKPFNNRELHTAIEMALYKHRMELLLEDSRELLSTTLKSIGDAVITTDADGIILFLNDTAGALLGGEAEKWIGRSLFYEVRLTSEPAPSGRGSDENGKTAGCEADFSELAERIAAAGSSVPNVGRYYLQTSGDAVPVECSVSPLLEPGNQHVKGIVFVLRDISGQIRVREMQERLASIVEFSEDAIIGLGIDGRIESWNRGAQKIFGFSEHEMIGSNISVLSPPQQSDELPLSLNSISLGESIEHFETLRKTKDGNLVHMALTLSPMRNAYGKISGISLIGRDIGETKILERRIMEISARERQSIGQELHDNLGQQLTGILFRAEALKNMLIRNNAGEEKGLSADIARLLRDALDETRKLSRGLMPVSLQPEGLPGALREISEQAEALFNVPIVLSLDENVIIEDAVTANQLYGIAREAVNNALKHGNPGSVSIVLERDVSEVILTVRDDGKGFRPSGSKGLGLRLMRYRAKMIGAYLEIFSPPEGGTSVTCRVAVPETVGSNHNDLERGY